MKYRFNGKEKRMAFGVYPAVSLAQARALRDEAKKKLAEGIDPSFAKKEEKLVRDVQLNNTFQAVARQRRQRRFASVVVKSFATLSFKLIVPKERYRICVNTFTYVIFLITPSLYYIDIKLNTYISVGR
ncbi:hypothetical protein CKO_02950 [Citrobacter koseri ATCC BAA-895]|uniref:Integrase DNA-binding domain-containing protein n=1 Tax=Citrobacter koseri (strain ATCC BAA-895 / CDC 4225-83 / SGSC4696) TaxID=290338 RepID=A8AKP3_CITK8|nr:hypothetical protein CKO_02950 [Citrobacter koseri ATCC BAA-895]